MVDQERRNSFYSRWNIQFDDAEQELTRFKHRLTSVLSKRLTFPYITKAAFDDKFCLILGVSPVHEWASSAFDNLDILQEETSSSNFRKLRVSRSIDESKTIPEIAEVIQSLFWTLEEINPEYLKPVAKAVQEALDYSPIIPINLVYDDCFARLYPAGARELDEPLVEETLIWLQGYPDVAKHFQDALVIHLQQDQEHYRNLLDNLRFAVEQLLQNVLDNQKSLENQKAPLGQWLKERNIHAQVRGLFSTLLNRFSRYQNNAVKHREAYSLPEIELMIYLTGIFLRFIAELA
jgi:hypothetical protein